LQATVYKKLAAEELEDQRREMITSEMRSQHIILLTKARECYYLTLDRLRSPGVDAKHPLNAELNSHIEEIESQLSHIDPDVMLLGGDGKSSLSYGNVQENLGTMKCHFRKLSEL
jgi:E3 SUMO-protein ligase RanBP2